MGIKIVNVFLNSYGTKVKVGRLALKERIIYFEYEKEFLAKDIELSPYKLPLKQGVFVCEDNLFEGLYGVFGDSLPDGWGRLLLDRHFLAKGLEYADITPLNRLSAIGRFGMGALSYEPIVEGLSMMNQQIDLDSLALSSMKILKGTSRELLDTLLAMGGSSAGARPKVVLQINLHNDIIHGNQKLQNGYEHYLVKFASSLDTQDIGKLEYIYSLMARDANIEMPETKLLSTDNHTYFAVKRFDREMDDRVHIHSVAGMVHSDFRLPSLDYDDLLSLTLHLTKDKEEQIKIYRLAVFNLFAHNRDDHAKNFSFLLDKKNRWKLSPAYDLTFSYGPSGEHSTTYLGEGRNPTEKHLKKLAIKHDIKDYLNIIDEIKKAISKFKIYAKQIGLDHTTSQNIYKHIQ